MLFQSILLSFIREYIANLLLLSFRAFYWSHRLWHHISVVRLKQHTYVPFYLLLSCYRSSYLYSMILCVRWVVLIQFIIIFCTTIFPVINGAASLTMIGNSPVLFSIVFTVKCKRLSQLLATFLTPQHTWGTVIISHPGHLFSCEFQVCYSLCSSCIEKPFWNSSCNWNSS